MSMLFPLYLAGLAGIAAPIVWHLIRRTPSGRTPFSTLMFLEPSPPRIVKRKNLDQVGLLCLRALILGLLALAFARPYLRTEARVDASGADGPRIALLVDTSASMRRAGLWDAAVREVGAALDAAPENAVFSLLAFDREPRSILDAAQAVELARDGGRALVRARMPSSSLLSPRPISAAR